MQDSRSPSPPKTQHERLKELEEVKKNLKDNEAASNHMIRALKNGHINLIKQATQPVEKDGGSKKARWKTILVNVQTAVDKMEETKTGVVKVDMTDWMRSFKVLLMFIAFWDGWKRMRQVWGARMKLQEANLIDQQNQLQAEKWHDDQGKPVSHTKVKEQLEAYATEILDLRKKVVDLHKERHQFRATESDLENRNQLLKSNLDQMQENMYQTGVSIVSPLPSVFAI
jgi:hypothetical protein